MTANGYSIEDVRNEASKEQQKAEHSERVQLIIFKLGTEEYGLSIDQIKEVVLTPRIAKMPQTPDYIKGVANIRGNIIAIMDLEQKFGLNSSNTNDYNHSNYTLVVESDQFKVGILVKEVPNTLSISVNDIDTASSFVQYTTLDTDSVIGVVKSGDRMIIMIDMIKLISDEESINL
jgi:purine-binding chemotaxis protein CheW